VDRLRLDGESIDSVAGANDTPKVVPEL
jgi:hypothetical protein